MEKRTIIRMDDINSELERVMNQLKELIAVMCMDAERQTEGKGEINPTVFQERQRALLSIADELADRCITENKKLTQGFEELSQEE